LDFLLPIWNPFIVHPMEQALRWIAAPLETSMSPGMAGGLAIIIFTIALRLILLPLSLIQIRSQRHQMAIQPELRALQKRYKGDRETLAREQMKLYRERGVNPAAGCIPLLIQLPILFGMYSAMNELATLGLTLDQVRENRVESARVVYAAERHTQPLPFNQFVLTRLEFIPRSAAPATVDVVRDESSVQREGREILNTTQSITLTPGQAPGLINPPGTPAGTGVIFFRAGTPLPDGTVDRNTPVVVNQPYVVEVWVDASQTNADTARAVVAFDPTQLELTHVIPPQLRDVAFKDRFLWLPSLGEPDLIRIGGLTIPGLLLIIMTITSFLTTRMTTLPTEDPQQQAMMRTMAFMPLMYLFFFLGTPAGLVLYWLISNLFSMVQQYFTVGMGLLAGDLQRFTGRDFQPPWAHIPPTTAPPGNGRADSADQSDGTLPAQSTRAAGNRRPAQRSGKGRRRGKR
jgi:YidC/Oxa1 family membrane protein insertase